MKSESEVAQLCLTLSDPMDYSLGFLNWKRGAGGPLEALTFSPASIGTGR